MIISFIKDTPEQKRKAMQLNLARQHAQEWKHIFAHEIAARSALGREHREERQRFRTTPNIKEQTRTIARHLQQILELKYEQQIVRDTLRVRQSEEQADLDKAIMCLQAPD